MNATPPPSTAGKTVAVPHGMLATALDDAARRSGQPREAIEVIEAVAVTWGDGSLGCPQPGMMYTQALVPGYRIVLRAPGGDPLSYHASLHGPPAYCPAARVVPPAPVPGGDQAI